jgi:outer membrane protein assembly factor BamE
MNIIKTIFILLISLYLSACQYMAAAQVVTQQGNMITEKQVSSLKIGMSKTDAAILLGSSLITPTFQKERWDYVFTWQKGQGPITVKRLSLYFDKDRLVQLKTMPNQ